MFELNGSNIYLSPAITCVLLELFKGKIVPVPAFTLVYRALIS